MAEPYIVMEEGESPKIVIGGKCHILRDTEKTAGITPPLPSVSEIPKPNDTKAYSDFYTLSSQSHLSNLAGHIEPQIYFLPSYERSVKRKERREPSGIQHTEKTESRILCSHTFVEIALKLCMICLFIFMFVRCFQLGMPYLWTTLEGYLTLGTIILLPLLYLFYACLLCRKEAIHQTVPYTEEGMLA
ncbi:uncharacterized protein LOC118195946 [Stegodyphus dumicola]|uniref:uncharacterized protein LOC118195946 n=1 Tax=Stegodyphus dumicola TaxID=202533 RepID=UPI0015AC994A|nr:uncharacterized protein LOC118195946 [Stegodyphus dumicola]